MTAQQVGDAVLISQGIPAMRMTQGEAAEFLGMNRKTLIINFIKRRRLRVGADRKIARKSVLSLFNGLDSLD